MTSAPARARVATRHIAEALTPLGIEHLPDRCGPGPGISPLAAIGGAWAWLGQGGSGYFDLPANVGDTLERIDRIEGFELAQNAAACAVSARRAADADGGVRNAPRAPDGASE